MPAPSVNTESSPTKTPEPTLTPVFTPTPTLVPTPIPPQQHLAPPAYDEIRDKQDVNNCGPATLALYLRYFGWEGNQYDISKLIKPSDDDRNVNVEELIHYVRTKAGWLNAEFRVGGDEVHTFTLMCYDRHFRKVYPSSSSLEPLPRGSDHRAQICQTPPLALLGFRRSNLG